MLVIIKAIVVMNAFGKSGKSLSFLRLVLLMMLPAISYSSCLVAALKYRDLDGEKYVPPATTSTISICTIVDNGYVVPLVDHLNSAALGMPSDCFARYYIIGMGLSDDNRAQLLRYNQYPKDTQYPSMQVSIVDGTPLMDRVLGVFGGMDPSRWPLIVFTKLLISDVPEFAHLSKIWYIDADTIFSGNRIKYLADPDVLRTADGQFVVGTNVYATDPVKLKARIEKGLEPIDIQVMKAVTIPLKDWLIDGGVMLFNLAHMRDRGILERLLDVLRQILHEYQGNPLLEVLTEETPIHCILQQGSRITFLPFKFNCNIEQIYAATFTELALQARGNPHHPAYKTITYMDAEYVNPVIAHMEGRKLKFWQMPLTDPLLREFFGELWVVDRVISGEINLSDLPSDMREGVFTQLRFFYANVGSQNHLVQRMPIHLQQPIRELSDSLAPPQKQPTSRRKPTYKRGKRGAS
ncbi:MAG: hypothetical protein LBJ03_03245 [Holosporales bacterium]|nr:hypothetical protein [Holosporales bacterium]